MVLMIEIPFTEEDIAESEFYAIAQIVDCIDNDRIGKGGFRNDCESDIESRIERSTVGILGEIALAKYLNVSSNHAKIGYVTNADLWNWKDHYGIEVKVARRILQSYNTVRRDSNKNSIVAILWYNEPSKKLFFVGVSHTNRIRTDNRLYQEDIFEVLEGEPD